MPNVENILAHRWKPGGPSPNPGGRPSSKAALDHALAETSDGKEIVERLVALMRHGKQETVRLKAAVELRDWLFGSPSPDRALALNGTLSEIRGEVLRFSASFGPSMSRGEAQDDTASAATSDAPSINVEGITREDEEVVESEASAEAVETPETTESPK